MNRFLHAIGRPLPRKVAPVRLMTATFALNSRLLAFGTRPLASKIPSLYDMNPTLHARTPLLAATDWLLPSWPAFPALIRLLLEIIDRSFPSEARPIPLNLDPIALDAPSLGAACTLFCVERPSLPDKPTPSNDEDLPDRDERPSPSVDATPIAAADCSGSEKGSSTIHIDPAIAGEIPPLASRRKRMLRALP